MTPIGIFQQFLLNLSLTFWGNRLTAVLCFQFQFDPAQSTDLTNLPLNWLEREAMTPPSDKPSITEVYRRAGSFIPFGLRSGEALKKEQRKGSLKIIVLS